MKDERKTKEQLVNEVAVLRQTIAELRASEPERVRAEERITHLNQVLRAVRKVNQRIIREKDRDRLIQTACKNLIETRGYHSAWAALLDESGRLVTSGEAGLGEAFWPLLDRLKRGELTACGREALKQPEAVVIPDVPSTCGDCPLVDRYGGRGAMTVRLEHGGKVYGLFSVSIPRHLAGDEDEQALFREVAEDIAFALHAIEVEEERKRANEALRESESFTKKVLESSHAGIYIYDLEKENHIFINQPYTRLTGYTLEDLHAMDGAEFVGLRHPDDHPRFAPHFERIAQARDGDFPEIEYRFRTAGGSWIWCLSRDAVFQRDDEGNLQQLIGTFLDVTERKHAQEALKEYSQRLEEMVEERTQELRDAQEQLVRREKLAVLGRLAGGVGHELRNPLGVISNAVYYLEMVHPDADDTTKEYLGMISSEVHNADRIISDLLDYARTWLADRERIAVSQLVARGVEKHPPPEGVQVATDIAADLPPAYVDPQQIEMALANLVTNAYQAVPEGGQVTIKTSEVSEKLPKSGVSISITDTGCGISAENMEKLFEPLFTTKARGIGLGLAVSRNLVEANGGTVEVESQEGEGSTFTVILPTDKRE